MANTIKNLIERLSRERDQMSCLHDQLWINNDQRYVLSDDDGVFYLMIEKEGEIGSVKFYASCTHEIQKAHYCSKRSAKILEEQLEFSGTKWNGIRLRAISLLEAVRKEIKSKETIISLLKAHPQPEALVRI